jgi:hypothetical protein
MTPCAPIAPEQLPPLDVSILMLFLYILGTNLFNFSTEVPSEWPGGVFDSTEQGYF